ncbi:MAG TPA: thioredoxin family protein [Phycisphaerae bacterium]|nr:thioredoxin family protein [Phycisphaerae bacterium]
MVKTNAKNVLIIVAVIAFVAGAAWFRSSHRGESAVDAATPADPRPAAAPADPSPPATQPEHPSSMRSVTVEPTSKAVAANDADSAESTKAEQQQEPAVEPQRPRLVDLGADKCIPCKKMAPILEQLREEYKGRLDVEFIDVWKNPGAGRQYGIRVIPTQILYDREGNEVWRHRGFISKENLKTVFAQKAGVR